jgi:hypothetical protein
LAISRSATSPMKRMKTNVSFHYPTGSVSHGETDRIGQPARRLGCQLKLLLALVLLAGMAFPAAASDPVGIYAFVDKVVFEPSDAAPERVQVWGGFALAQGRGDTYEAARRGYLYFKLRPGQEEVSRKEWADLKAVAGTGQIVAFGSRHDAKGAVRELKAKPENPDPHPKGWGLTKVRVRDYPPLNQLVALQKKSDAKSPGKSASR